jgi:hypothetical protein
MSEPRNVTPGAEPEAKPDDRQEWRGWSWDSRRPGYPLLGVLLVLIGIGLLVQYVFPVVSVGTLILLAIGIALLSAWLIGRSWVAMVPGFLVLALGIGELLEDLAAFRPAGQDVPGLASSMLAIAFLVIFVVARASGRHWTWPIWMAAIFGLIGIAQLSAFVALPQFGAFVPVLIIVLGLVVLFNWRQRAR